MHSTHAPCSAQDMLEHIEDRRIGEVDVKSAESRPVALSFQTSVANLHSSLALEVITAKGASTD